MSKRAVSASVLTITLLALAGAVGTLVLGESGPTRSLAIVPVIFVVTGVYVAWRVPSNSIGWLISLFGLSVGSWISLETIALSGVSIGAWILWVASMLWVPSLIIMLIFVPLHFPDGRAPGSRWKWIGRLSIAGGFLLASGNAFTDGLLDDYGFENPALIDIPTVITEMSLLAGVLLIIVGIVAGVSAAAIRFRRSSGVLRQQMKWFAASTLVLLGALALQVWAYEFGPRDLAPFFLLVGSLAVPVALALAILKYRLYEIDRIVSRTVSYALIVVLLGGFFVTGVVVVPNQIMSGEAPAWLVATTTLATAALFNPLRRRIQDVVDRRFNRSRFDAARVMDEFAERLRGLVGGDELVAGWSDVAIETMQPQSIGVWVR